MIRLDISDPRSASLARALCHRCYHGRYWFHPSTLAEFRVLDSAAWEARQSWDSGDRVRRFRLPPDGPWLRLPDAVRLARLPLDGSLGLTGAAAEATASP